MSPSISFLTHSAPAPGISGDRIRVFHLMRELTTRGWSVRLWSLVGPDDPPGSLEALQSVTDEVVVVPRGISQRRRVARLAVDTVTRQAFQANWFRSRDTARSAAAWLANGPADPIVVEQLYMCSFVPASEWGRMVLDTHNHETARIRSMATGEGGFGRRLAARLQLGPVERYERMALTRAARVLAVSQAEAQAFETIAPGRVRLIPNGVDVEGIMPLVRPTKSRQLLYLGSLGYGANADAVRHFADDIAPRLVQSGTTLLVVGGGGGATVLDAARRSAISITVAGFVPDLEPVFRASRVMVVPLRHGGGTRLKILEALAWGLPVVATSIGAAGLGLVDGIHALIADEPGAFATGIDRLLNDDALWATLSANGRAFVEERFGWNRIGEELDRVMRDVVTGIQAAAPR